jgi:hypothetical protein
MITVNLERAAHLSLEVTNIAGQKVMDLDRGRVSAGTHFFQLEAKDFAPGIYFYSVISDNSTVTKKMIVK